MKNAYGSCDLCVIGMIRMNAEIIHELTPDKTLKFEGEKCVGGKLSEERIRAFV